MRPITETEVETLKYSCNQGDLELSDREITRRNRRYADAMPLLLAERDRLQRELDAARAGLAHCAKVDRARVGQIAALRERAEKAEADNARLRAALGANKPFIAEIIRFFEAKAGAGVYRNFPKWLEELRHLAALTSQEVKP